MLRHGRHIKGHMERQPNKSRMERQDNKEK